jgi:tetratricopeptide (TPR) repeat protein
MPYKIVGLALGTVILLSVYLPAQTIDEAEAYLRQKKYAEAKSIYEKMIDNNKNDAEAHYHLGWLLLTPGFKDRDVDDAVDQLEKAVDLNPNNADYQYRYGAALGQKAQNSGMLKQAFLAPKIKNAFKRAVELNPQNVQAHIGLANYYMVAPSIMGGDEDEAWKQVEEVIKLDEVQGCTVKASFLLRAKKNDEAENEYKALVKSKPKEWRVWHRYGYFCMHLERYDNAIEHFKKYVELRPDTADSYQSLAEALLKKGNVDLAMVNLNKSLSIDKEYVPAIISLGEAYQAKGQKKEAKETYQRAISLTQNEFYKKQAENKLKEVE